MFDSSKQKALKELLEVLGKGIDLLANENLDKDLYEAFEKYADSTIKMVDEAYNRNYSYFSNNRFPCYSDYLIDARTSPYISAPHSAASAYTHYLSRCSNYAEYRKKLKDLLQKLILLAQKVVYE